MSICDVGRYVLSAVRESNLELGILPVFTRLIISLQYSTVKGQIRDRTILQQVPEGDDSVFWCGPVFPSTVLFPHAWGAMSSSVEQRY